MVQLDLHTKATVEQFMSKLKRRQVVGSFRCAMETCEVFKTLVAKSTCKNQEQLITVVKAVGRHLSEAAPIELAVANITRRVLYIVREEVMAIGEEEDGNEAPPEGLSLTRARSLENWLLAGDAQPKTFQGLPAATKQAIIHQIKDLKDEIHAMSTSIAEQSLEHIHANEVILCFGNSRTVTNFLRFAAQKGRKFQVIVAATTPRWSGHDLATELAGFNVQVTVIPDTAIFAVMSRVNKVIVGTHAVLANGGLCAPSGLHHVALAAKHHSVPLVVCTGLYKLSPLFPHDQDTFNQLRTPNEILSGAEATSDLVRVLNPEFDYVPPDLVNLFITNLGGHNPSYIYRLLAELYEATDYSLAVADEEGELETDGGLSRIQSEAAPDMIRAESTR